VAEVVEQSPQASACLVALGSGLVLDPPGQVVVSDRDSALGKHPFAFDGNGGGPQQTRS